MNLLPLAMVLCVLALPQSGAMPETREQPRNVALLVYDGMEILDFAGPGEVFQAAGEAYNVYTVGAKPDPIVSQRFVTITPQYTVQNAPAPDILVLPGGGTGGVRANAELMKWVKQSADRAEIVLTVCTGAFVLADTQLLDGHEATTWYGAVDRFRDSYPKVKVHDHVRFVDNGKFVTTAGVSAGIDGALHVVAKLHGSEAAEATARYMEYDKWAPDAGFIVDNETNRRYRAAADSRAARRVASAVPAVLEGGVQRVSIAVTDRGFEPAVVSARPGLPLRLIFDRRTPSACFESVKIPALQVPTTPLLHGRTTAIDLAPAPAGRYEFSCGMEMFRGTLVVTE